MRIHIDPAVLMGLYIIAMLIVIMVLVYKKSPHGGNDTAERKGKYLTKIVPEKGGKVK